ncbi:hypothetical protein HPT27_12230 [Permianibacter sp. IMCC34836]|uniref:hypothetical protein n=1 Tax=Permianibacter fluminis TaxID=2738515 RepID=UPI0015574D44|nr:hypothetical protein [Permianibacter fluminis]NQD37795.1 hypothetical protein [Permianibacter fluminis]
MSNNRFASMFVTFLVGLLAVAFVYIVVIQPLWQQNNGGPLVMRTYAVSADYADEVRSALQNAMLTGEEGKAIGRVSLAPNGQLIVTAPNSMQKGVESLLNDIAGFSPGATPSVKFEAWFVTAINADKTDNSSIPALQEVLPALDAITEVQGNQQFKLLEKITVHVRTGQSSTVSSANGIFEVNPSVRRGANEQKLISAELKFQMRGPESLRTETELKSGELLVLGQTSNHQLVGDRGVPSEQRLYYIVRATL